MPYHGERITRPDGSIWEWNQYAKQWIQVQGPVINPTLKVEKVEPKKSGS